MKNLAGDKNCDKTIREELTIAGIPIFTEESTGEVPYSAIGKIGYWTFRRAWYYWMVSCEGEGLPLEKAEKLHHTEHPTNKIMGNSIRSGGHCGCPAPSEYGAQPVYDEELNEKLKELGYKEEYSEMLERSYIPITIGEVSELCNNGKLSVERFVSSYHIDDQIGLNKFVECVREVE